MGKGVKLPCLVCGRAEGKRVTLPNGKHAVLCDDCFDDSFRLAEAMRRC